MYAFDPGEELISWCACLVTPDQTVNLGVNRDLPATTLTGVVPTSVTVKLLSTLAGGDGSGSSCTNSAATVTAATLAMGSMAAWGTTLHTTPGLGNYATTETAFTPATLGLDHAVQRNMFDDFELPHLQSPSAGLGHGVNFGRTA